MAFRNTTKDAGTSMLDGPIPGQSLTDEPGKAAWENPPEYVDVAQALDYILQQATRRDFLKQYYVLVQNKVPLEAIARVILFQGFGQGKWTVDMMVLLSKPVLQMLVAIAKAAGMEYIIPMPYHQKSQDMTKIVEQSLPMEAENPQEDMQEMGGMMMPPSGGLMSPPGAKV